MLVTMTRTGIQLSRLTISGGDQTETSNGLLPTRTVSGYREVAFEPRGSAMTGGYGTSSRGVRRRKSRCSKCPDEHLAHIPAYVTLRELERTVRPSNSTPDQGNMTLEDLPVPL